MKTTAIIPIYNDSNLIQKCLESLFVSLEEYPKEYVPDIIVIDDGSPDEKKKEAARKYCEEKGVKFIAKEENTGFSNTINTAAAFSDPESHILLINNDIEFVNDNWLYNMLQMLDQENVGIVGAKLLYPNGLIQHAGVYFSIIQNIPFHRFHYAPGNLACSNKALVCPVTGALQFIRRELWNRIGGLDERYKMAFEDVDFGMRAMSNGVLSVYHPGVIAIHHEGETRGDGALKKPPSRKIQNWTNEAYGLFVRTWSVHPLSSRFRYNNV